MVDIKEQKLFDLLTEEKDIVITNNTKNVLVKQIDDLLGGVLENLSEKPLTTLYTLGKIKAKRLHVVNFKNLKCRCKSEDIFAEIAKIEVDNVVLVDTFENEKYHRNMQLLSEIILTKNYTFNKFKSKNDEKNKDFYFLLYK